MIWSCDAPTQFAELRYIDDIYRGIVKPFCIFFQTAFRHIIQMRFWAELRIAAREIYIVELFMFPTFLAEELYPQQEYTTDDIYVD